MEYLVIGAGPAGLGMAKSLKEAQIRYDHVEANDALGGNWYHGVYKTLYTDASRDVMQYPEFPMPESYPDFLSREQMLEYLNNYAGKFDLREKIRFNIKVCWVEAIEDNLWKVHFNNKSFKIYKGVIICNGHHWDKNHPELPGKYTGEYFHSKEYKEPAQLKNKKVLVIGSGNSAADIACEASRVGKMSVMSMRESPWIFPKSFMGVPLARIKARKAPAFLDPLLVKLLLRLTFGRHEHYGLPEPGHRPFEKHPTVSEELPYYLKHGRIMTKPEIVEIENKNIRFKDNTEVECDLIVGATGFKLSFPFLPGGLVRTDGQNLHCLGHCVYPDYKGLFFLGWQQVRGGVGALAGAFSKVIVDLIMLEEEYNIPAGSILKKMKNEISTTHLYGSKEVYQWIKKHNYKAMAKAAGKIQPVKPHENIPAGRPVPEDIYSMKVY